ncbi:MAG: hypothetical protein PVJ86_11020 [Phycisphaerales bacterium]|jgi:hypothetical protein
MPESPATYKTATPAPRFYAESLTLAEHQLLKRIRQLCRRDGTVILILEIENRNSLKASKAMQEIA